MELVEISITFTVSTRSSGRHKHNTTKAKIYDNIFQSTWNRTTSAACRDRSRLMNKRWRTLSIELKAKPSFVEPFFFLFFVGTVALE